ncbi:uncharacterized protein ACIB01_001411 [Guaruba guarouba]
MQEPLPGQLMSTISSEEDPGSSSTEESQSVTIHYRSGYQQDPRGRSSGTEQGREKQLRGQEAVMLQGWHLSHPATDSILGEMDRASAPWHRVCCVHSSWCRAGERTPLFPLPPPPAYNSPHSCSPSGVAAADSSIQLQNEEKEAHDYIKDFVKSTRRDQESKMKFLASINMLCRASLQGRYQSPTSHELLNELEALMQNEAFDSMDTMMWQQALLAIAALSEYRENLLDNRLYEHIGGTFSFVASETISQQTPFYDQILKTLDSVLEVLICGASPRSCIFITGKILQALLPITASEDMAKRRKAVEWIARLTWFLSPTSMLEEPVLSLGMRAFCRCSSDSPPSPGDGESRRW